MKDLGQSRACSEQQSHCLILNGGHFSAPAHLCEVRAHCDYPIFHLLKEARNLCFSVKSPTEFISLNSLGPRYKMSLNIFLLIHLHMRRPRQNNTVSYLPQGSDGLDNVWKVSRHLLLILEAGTAMSTTT